MLVFGEKVEKLPRNFTFRENLPDFSRFSSFFSFWFPFFSFFSFWFSILLVYVVFVDSYGFLEKGQGRDLEKIFFPTYSMNRKHVGDFVFMNREDKMGGAFSNLSNVSFGENGVCGF